MLTRLAANRRLLVAVSALLVIGVATTRFIDRDRGADDLAVRISDPRPGPLVDGTDPGDDGGPGGARSGVGRDAGQTAEAGRDSPVITTGPLDRSRTGDGVAAPRSIAVESQPPPGPALPAPSGTGSMPEGSEPVGPTRPVPGPSAVPGPSGRPDPSPGPSPSPGPPAEPGPSVDPDPLEDPGLTPGPPPRPQPSPDPSSNTPIAPSGSPPSDPGDVDGKPYDARARACAELGRSPIGAVQPGVDDPILTGAGRRFRLLDDAMQKRSAEDPGFGGALVCADPVRRFRNDLVAQQLHVAGSTPWTLMAGHAATDPVIVIDELELAVFRWDAPGIVGTPWNMLGVPTGRETVHGLEVIRTTHGGIVMPRSDSIGVPVLGGAWTIWERDGASMGRPVSVPWSEGQGARQSFENGLLSLPAVTSPFEALVADPVLYEWRPLSGNVIGEPLETNTVVKHDGRSYYVGSDRQLHWIPSTGQWSCATSDLRARPVDEPIDLTLLATLPLGPVFRCADWK